MRSRLAYLLSALLLLGVTGSCKKKKYPPSVIDNDPVYFANMTVDNDAVSIKAGEDDFYMYSDLKQDSAGVYNFIARLANTGCNGCGPALQIQINDFQTSAPGGNMFADSTLRVKRFSYYVKGSGQQYEVNFAGTFNRV